ncbi:PEP-utilizing enzyme [Crocinitomicaceae bacterium]|nr:PEP-utilizing enzyme [Crocinitomicaceae bacterium]
MDPKSSVEEVGGKAFILIKLKDLKFNIPEFIVLDKSELLKHVSEEKLANKTATELQRTIEDIELKDELLKHINKSFDNASDKTFAVRSSAVNEDGGEFSFAGQYESYLYVKLEDVPKFVKKVWCSNFSERVIAYHKSNNIERQNGIAVIIQEMIDPEVSGVAFGINPNTGEVRSKVINSVYGVGEGIVSGELNADSFIINSTKTESNIADKEQMAKKDASGKIKFVDLPEELKNKASLSEQNIIAISKLLDDLNPIMGGPQDIEFALKNDELFLLQSRPITAVYKETKPAENRSNRIIWDNSNIVESYPGVTTPLTFSYILNAYSQVYEQLADIFGVSKKKISANKYTFEHMIGLINGRVYYNLFSWYRMLTLFPGYKLNARFMENMMGVKERFDLPKEDNSSKFGALIRTIWMVVKILGHMFTIKSQTKLYLKDVKRTIAEFKELKLEEMSAYETMIKWKEIEAYLTSRWKAPILTDSFALYNFGKLQQMIEKGKFSDNPNLHNDLLCGSKDIISVEPIHRTLDLAAISGEDEALKELICNNNSNEILKSFKNGDHPEFYAQLNDYIEDFGDRCVGELKLETISFKEDPSLYIDFLKSLVVQGVTRKSASSSVDIDIRIKAEAEVSKAYRYRPIKRMMFNRRLKNTRFLVSNRENLRYERTRVFGLTREMFSHIGKEFEKAGVLDNFRDVYYLTMQEMFGAIEGSIVDTDLKALTAMRKKEYQKYEEMEEPSERFTTYDGVHLNNDFFDTSLEQDFDGDLKGIGCCPGIVKARVQVVKHPKDVAGMNGDILVTSSTDPGWVTLFPTASAIIVERGSLLSHSAIVSREMGIPCIVGVTGLLKTLKTGDLIEMNGSTGQIKIIENEE